MPGPHPRTLIPEFTPSAPTPPVTLAATLATSLVTLDILVWGLIATAIQLLAFFAATALLRGLREQIEAGNIAAASALVGIQLAVAVVNAGAMAG